MQTVPSQPDGPAGEACLKGFCLRSCPILLVLLVCWLAAAAATWGQHVRGGLTDSSAWAKGADKAAVEGEIQLFIDMYHLGG